ncbi:helix-turn-helix domain-containing protein [Methylocystis sp. SB2]|uniref:helix-turn-helix domain-containing protein n=1 Tax=Methylocystis sp. (strain SB2) TaxID=743836 RepID=UPI001EFB261D|nr:helix-turn-helix domain-containing protein [Methylocystis sp. SB2]ULO23141.1 helix-turn-helix domain-containing protein [Methylocystis sp. SB2]
MTDAKKLATAKLEFLVAVALDAELPKLSMRAAAILAGRYMHANNDGVAWPRIARLCDDLQIRSESKVRGALYALVDGGYLEADRNRGDTTRYRIAPRFFETGAEPHDRAGSGDTQPRSGAEGTPRSRATPQPQNGAGGRPIEGRQVP